MPRDVVVHVGRAKATITQEPIPNLAILATEEFADTRSLEISMEVFRAEAKKIADALFQCLPGGTLDQLLREMLERKASQLIVRFDGR